MRSRRRKADGGSCTGSARSSKAQRTQKGERTSLVTSQERGEDRQRAHGDQNASQRRIAFGGDLGGAFRREQGGGLRLD